MHKKMLLTLSLFALSMLLGPSPTEASPPIRHRTKQQIDKQTDFLLRAKIIRRTTVVKGLMRTTRVRVKIYRVTAQNKRARAHRGLKRGAMLEFTRSCSLRKPTPFDLRMSGYPNGRCGSSWTAMPHALTGTTGKLVQLRLKLGTGKGKQTKYATVPTTFPATARAMGRRIK